MRCYRTKADHTSTLVNKPGVGQNWQNYWKEVPCCSPSPSSSSSSSGGGGGQVGSSSGACCVASPVACLQLFKSECELIAGGTFMGERVLCTTYLCSSSPPGGGGGGQVSSSSSSSSSSGGGGGGNLFPQRLYGRPFMNDCSGLASTDMYFATVSLADYNTMLPLAPSVFKIYHTTTGPGDAYSSGWYCIDGSTINQDLFGALSPDKYIVGNKFATCASCSGSPSASTGGGTVTSHTLVQGFVPDWNQPLYYEASGVSNTNYGALGNPITNPSLKGEYYAPLKKDALKFWCAPAAAACQLGHLQHHYAAKLMNIPTFMGDNLDAGSDVNPNLKTIAFNSAPGWADFMLDGPTFRGKVGSQQFNRCRQADFGWWMDTNGAGMTGGQNYAGTTLAKTYDGLLKFYGWVGYDNILGMAYHLPHNGSTLTVMGNQPYSNNSNSDLTQVWNAIVNEIDNERTVIGTTMGYELHQFGPTKSLTPPTPEPYGHYYVLGNPGQSQPTNSPPVPMVDGDIVENGEVYTWEVYDANGIGHTITIIGYIKAGSVDDIGVSASTPTNWLIVRDNFEQTGRNVILPFDQALGGGWRLWDLLLSTCYTNPTNASFTSELCKSSSSSPSGGGGGGGGGGGIVSSSSSSSSDSSSSPNPSLAPGYHDFYAFPCVGNSWGASGCSAWYAMLGNAIPISLWHSDDYLVNSTPKSTCAQADGTTLTYAITRVWGATSLGTGVGDCALIIRDHSGTVAGQNPQVAYQLGTANVDCNNCELTITAN